MGYENEEQMLVGKKIIKIYMNEDYLKFETDKGNIVYSVEGECCSSSIFYDFVGVEKLLKNGPVTEVKEVDLHPSDIITTKEKYPTMEDKKDSDDSIQVYGYQITTEDKDLGLVTSVFSFRNYSNGYYGGSLDRREGEPNCLEEFIELKKDF